MSIREDGDDCSPIRGAPGSNGLSFCDGRFALDIPNLDRMTPPMARLTLSPRASSMAREPVLLPSAVNSSCSILTQAIGLELRYAVFDLVRYAKVVEGLNVGEVSPMAGKDGKRKRC